MYAHTQTILPKDWGRRIVPQRSNHCHFHYAPRFITSVLAHMLDSLVRVSRRGKENHSANKPSHVHRNNLNQTGRGLFQRIQPRQAPIKTQRPLHKQRGKYGLLVTGFLRFYFSNFRYSLTLFSKFFASFPHGTCTLSVSNPYLVLDGIYHHFRAAIPNNSTPGHLVQKAWYTGISPSLLPFSRGLDLAR
jgi:hypothetical protein